MQTRTRNAVGLLVFAAIAAASLTWLWSHRRQPADRARAVDAVPAGALLVATADLRALRASPVFGRLLRDGREIPGLGKVRDLCGFDPLDAVDEVAFAVPAADESGDFGFVGAGKLEAEPLLSCAAKAIAARGGRPVVTTVGGFQTVRDVEAASGGGGEIAVRDGGPAILSGGAYLRSMIDAADARAPTIRQSAAHARLAESVGGNALRVSVVLTPEQRRSLQVELGAAGAAPAPIAAGLGVELGSTVALHALLMCESAADCAELGARLRAAKDERAADTATRVAGFGSVLERTTIELAGDLVHARVRLEAEEARMLLERLLALRGLRKPPSPEGEAPATGSSSRRDAGAPAPDDVLRPAAPSTSRDAGTSAGEKARTPKD